MGYIDGLKDFFSVFQVSIEFNAWTIPLVVLFIGTIIGGYFLISSQVKLVKKEIWNFSDTLKCSIFAFFFGSGLTIIYTMIETFIINRLGLSYQNQASFLLIPLFFCLIFITLYPLLEFVFMAHNSTELAVNPIQKPFEWIIKKFTKPVSYFVAFLLYIVVIILPPFLLVLLLNVDLMIAWLSCVLIYPMIIVIYYGSIGFIIGYESFYVNIPNLERSMFLHFDSSNRAIKDFLRNPLFYIVFGVLNYIYIYEFYKMFSTLSHFFKEYVPANNLINIDWSIPISLIFAISAFFTRYWKRKVQLSAQSIFFSGFLIAAVGVNVCVNYLIMRPAVFQDIFLQWDFSKILYESRPIRQLLKVTELNLIGAIEETMLFFIISYFFFFQKDRKLLNDTIKSAITKANEDFNPYPPFNMIRSDKKEQREFAKSVLLEIYDRVPIKKGYYLSDNLFKEPLFDAISDPVNKNAQKVGREILGILMKNHPKEVKTIVIEGINSSNIDKSLRILQVLFTNGENLLKIIDPILFYDLLNHHEFNIRFYSIRNLSKYYSIKSSINHDFSLTKKEVSNLIFSLNNPDFKIQKEILAILSEYPEGVPQRIFSERMDHHIPMIKSIAASAASAISLDNLSETTVPKLIEMLDNTNIEIKAAVMRTLSKIGNFEKNKIPIEPFKEAIVHKNKDFREAAILGLISYLKEKPYGLNPNYILSLLKKKDKSIQNSLLKILGIIWKKSPKLIFPVLVDYLSSSDSALKKNAQKILIEMGFNDPKQTVSNLIIKKETETFIKRGMISDTIVKIAKKHWKRVITISMEFISNEREFIRLNSVNVLSAISINHPNDIPVKKIIEIWKKESSQNIKKEIGNIFANIANSEPKLIKSYIPEFITTYTNSNHKVRVSIAKMFIELSKNNSNLVPFSFSKMMSEDKNPSLRESGMKLLMTNKNKKSMEILDVLLKGLKDKEWAVKNAAADGIASLSASVNDPEIFKQVKKLLDSKEKWVKLKGIEVITKIAKNGVEIITLDEILKLSSQMGEERNFYINIAKLLGVAAAQDFDKAFPSILVLMKNPDEKIRKSMISSLVSLSTKIPIKELVPKLLHYLSDETPTVLQQSIALALRRIVKYESKEIKERVISILKIRVLSNQDEVISEVLSELRG